MVAMNALLTIDHVLALIAIGLLFLLAKGLDSISVAIASFHNDYLRVNGEDPSKDDFEWDISRQSKPRGNPKK
jgi:hypothetical protein